MNSAGLKSTTGDWSGNLAGTDSVTSGTTGSGAGNLAGTAVGLRAVSWTGLTGT